MELLKLASERVKLETEVLEILGTCSAADMGNIAQITGMVGILCPCIRDQKERNGLSEDNFSGFFGGPEGLSYLQLQKFTYKTSF